MYAAGRIPGSFFRREGRPSEDAILTCRLTDRPLRPSFAKGLRNEVQIVATVLALDPDYLYDVVAINAASMSTKLSGVPFSGPIGATRMAHVDGQWVAFPTNAELARATFDMVVAGRVLPDGDVAIMMVEAEATEHAIGLIAAGAPTPTEEVVASGLEAAKPAIRELCRAQERAGGGGRQAGRRVPDLPRLHRRRLRGRRRPRPRPGGRGAADRRQGRAGGGARPDPGRALVASPSSSKAGRRRSSPRSGPLTKAEVRARVLRDRVRIDGRGPRDIRPLTAEVERAAAGARLGAVRAG